ncbi:MAG: hypothetical protein WBB82_14405 [Limnothrix sp.]
MSPYTQISLVKFEYVQRWLKIVGDRPTIGTGIKILDPDSSSQYSKVAASPCSPTLLFKLFTHRIYPHDYSLRPRAFR